MDTNDAHIQAELALASYAKDLIPGSPPSIPALIDGGKGMSQKQAEQFAETWTVLDQFTDSPSGVSATIFQQVVNGIPTGAKYLAIRGTQPEVGDIVLDVILAVGVSGKLNPQFTALKDHLDNVWLADGGLLHDEAFTVTGHSLGGYLAEAVKEQYSTQVTEAYLFNAPGSGGLIGNIADLVSGVFGQTVPGASSIWNIKASEGASIIAGLGSQSSAAIPVQIEAASGAGFVNHSIVRLTDALAIQALYSTLAPSLTQAQLNALVDASGNPMNQTLEAALDNWRIAA